MTWHHTKSHDITSHQITPHDITWHDMTSHDITPNRMTSHHTKSHDITTHQITWHDITTPNHITSNHTTLHTTPHHTITPHHTTPHYTTPHHTTPHHTHLITPHYNVKCLHDLFELLQHWGCWWCRWRQTLWAGNPSQSHPFPGTRRCQDCLQWWSHPINKDLIIRLQLRNMTAHLVLHIRTSNIVILLCWM